jgi:hypothetical protein
MNGTPTMNLSRRHVLATASALIPAALLAGCAGGPSALATYAITADNAALQLLTTLPASPTTTAAIAALKALDAIAAPIAATPSVSGASIAQQLYDAVKAALPVAIPLASVVPGLSLGLGALQALLPVLAQLGGLQAAAAAIAPAPGVPVMTAAQAVALFGPK